MTNRNRRVWQLTQTLLHLLLYHAQAFYEALRAASDADIDAIDRILQDATRRVQP